MRYRPAWVLTIYRHMAQGSTVPGEWPPPHCSKFQALYTHGHMVHHTKMWSPPGASIGTLFPPGSRRTSSQPQCPQEGHMHPLEYREVIAAPPKAVQVSLSSLSPQHPGDRYR